MSCCRNTETQGTYDGQSGPVTYCKKCGRAGKAVTTNAGGTDND